MLFKKAANEFLLLKKSNVRTNTFKFYETKVRLLNRLLGDLDVSEIGSEEIDSFVNQLNEKRSNYTKRTILKYMMVLKLVLNEVLVLENEEVSKHDS